MLFDRPVPESIKDELLALHNCKSIDECSVEEGILRTNGIGCDLTVPEGHEPTHSAIFLEMSCVNHRLEGPNSFIKLSIC